MDSSLIQHVCLVWSSFICSLSLKMVQLSPLTDERMRRNGEKREEKIRPPYFITKAAPKWSQGPYFLLTFLFISPHPLIYERGELYHLNEHKNLLHICQHVELVNYPFKWQRLHQAANNVHCAVSLRCQPAQKKKSFGVYNVGITLKIFIVYIVSESLQILTTHVTNTL